MILLGIETSCDDTSCGLVEDGQRLLSLCTGSQDDLHTNFGGIVPELAAREHCLQLDRVVGRALSEADLSLHSIDAIAVTAGPGLVSSLLTGVTAAKTLAAFLQKPILAVDHLEAHVASLALGEQKPELPLICLLVSGGHTQLRLVESWDRQSILGQTLDDSVGEAFDKVARILGLAYPGGPAIDLLSRDIAHSTELLPESKVTGLNFSFSGLKSAVLRLWEKENNTHSAQLIAASFQQNVVRELTKKLKRASDNLDIKNIAIAGGVSANTALRARLATIFPASEYRIYMPELRFCTDNGAMVAAAGYLCPRSRSLDFAVYAR